MAWIRVIDEEDGEDDLREFYARVASARGPIASIWKIHSVSPRTMGAHLEIYREVMFGRSDLTRRERETIGVAVSAVNRCHY